MPLAGTPDRRTFERDLRAVEALAAVTEGEFAAATAEEQGDLRAEMRAEAAVFDVRADTVKNRWGRLFGRRPMQARSDAPERETRDSVGDEGRWGDSSDDPRTP
jgi:hypothetical protein